MTEFFAQPLVVAAITGLVCSAFSSGAVLYGFSIHVQYIRQELQRHDGAIMALQNRRK